MQLKLRCYACFITFMCFILIIIIRLSRNEEKLGGLKRIRNSYNSDIDFVEIAAPYYDSSLIRRLKNYMSELRIDELISEECIHNETLRQYWLRTKNVVVPEADSWTTFYADIGSCDLYRDDRVVENLLHDLNVQPIRSVSIMEGGTQIKLILLFENGQEAIFKPMRFGRDYETNPNHFYFSDFERHNAEIATFHLDRIIGLRRAIPTVGRVFKMASEFFQKATEPLASTFFISPAENMCFVGKCDYYCITTHAICAKEGFIEGSVQVFLPASDETPRQNYLSPYRRTYSKKKKLAEWQTNVGYCANSVKLSNPFSHGRMLIDLIDLYILDFLTCNQDRHHFETFEVFDQNSTYPIHMDNGRAFGRTDIDHEDILLPLIQCCVIRPSTLHTLLRFYRDIGSLSRSLHRSLSRDSVAPILAEKHYVALERRLQKILVAVETCVKKNKDGIKGVVMPEFHSKNSLLKWETLMVDVDHPSTEMNVRKTE